MMLLVALVALMAAAPAQADVAVPPAPPEQVEAVAPGTGGVQLTWQDPAFDGGAPVDFFRVYRDGVFLTDWYANAYFDPDGAEPSVYFVTAVNEVGESAPSSTAAVMMGGGGCIHMQPTPIPVTVSPFNCIDMVLDTVDYVLDLVDRILADAPFGVGIGVKTRPLGP